MILGIDSSQTISKNNPLPREPMVATNKLSTEVALSEAFVTLGQAINIYDFTIALSNKKFITWISELESVINTWRILKKKLESLIG